MFNRRGVSAAVQRLEPAVWICRKACWKFQTLRETRAPVPHNNHCFHCCSEFNLSLEHNLTSLLPAPLFDLWCDAPWHLFSLQQFAMWTFDCTQRLLSNLHKPACDCASITSAVSAANGRTSLHSLIQSLKGPLLKMSSERWGKREHRKWINVSSSQTAAPQLVTNQWRREICLRLRWAASSLMYWYSGLPAGQPGDFWFSGI